MSSSMSLYVARNEYRSSRPCHSYNFVEHFCGDLDAVVEKSESAQSVHEGELGLNTLCSRTQISPGKSSPPKHLLSYSAIGEVDVKKVLRPRTR